MSDAVRPVQEDELHAYVDDRLDLRRRAEIDAALADDPELRRRVDAWRNHSEMLHAAYAFKAREPVPARLEVSRLLAERSHTPAGARVAAGIALALMVGAAGGTAAGWYARGQQRPGEIARIATEATAAYRTFASDNVRPVEVDGKNRAELVTWMSQRLGRPLDIPDLSKLGYRFMGGRLLSASLGPAALLMYEDDRGSRMILFVLPMHGAMTEPLQPIRANTAGGYAWINNRIGYGVVSADDTPAIQTLAEQMQTDTR
jgi:anti-sigma factor RsiW